MRGPNRACASHIQMACIPYEQERWCERWWDDYRCCGTRSRSASSKARTSTTCSHSATSMRARPRRPRSSPPSMVALKCPLTQTQLLSLWKQTPQQVSPFSWTHIPLLNDPSSLPCLCPTALQSKRGMSFCNMCTVVHMTDSHCTGNKDGPSEAAPGDSSSEEAEADASRPSGIRSARRRRRSDASSGAPRGSDPAEPAKLTGALATSQEPPGTAPPRALLF